MYKNFTDEELDKKIKNTEWIIDSVYHGWASLKIQKYYAGLVAEWERRLDNK